MGKLLRREAMGMFVVETMQLDLPRRGLTSAPPTPASAGRDRAAQRRADRLRARNENNTVQVMADDIEEVPAASQSSVVGTPNAIAGPSRSSQSTPVVADVVFVEPVTPSPTVPPKRMSKRKSMDPEL